MPRSFVVVDVVRGDDAQPQLLCQRDEATVAGRIAVDQVLLQFDEEAVARWPEVEATGIGATEFEAIESLRKDIAELFEDLSSSDSSELSDQTAGALAVLRSVIEKRG